MTEVKSKEELLQDRNNLIYSLFMDDGYTNSQLATIFNLKEESIQRIVTTLYHINLIREGR